MTGNQNGGWDGGLPRHALDGFAAVGGRIQDGPNKVFHQEQTKFGFAKEIFKAKPAWYPEGGTDLEQLAMRFHAQKFHNTYKPDGTPAVGAFGFRTNGAPPQAGAPFCEPCIDDQGSPLTSGVAGQWFGGSPNSFVALGTSNFNATTPRVYKGANVQIDAVLNKKGHHYPQQRIVSLWNDVTAFINKTKAPEPLVMRNNTLDCTRFLHTNLVPLRFEVDDYQVTTPTDIIGQHIHLPKWDLPAADGAANGWNYEDGTLSPGSVRERIHAINTFNPAGTGNPANKACALVHDDVIDCSATRRGLPTVHRLFAERHRRLGWRGSSEQWRHWSRAVLHLSGLATPLVLSVHSVVSWDFATSLVPGWHTTIFAPYFVAGAIFSGIAMVITVLVPVRKAFGLEAYLRSEHFDNMGKLILLTSSIVGYAYGMEYFMAWYSANPYEQMSFWFRGFGYHWTSTWIMIRTGSAGTAASMSRRPR